MFLLEHHGKELLAARGVPVPAGVLVASSRELRDSALPSGPWMVKAQVAAGGRGKAGAIRPAASIDEAAQVIDALAGTNVKGKPICGFRVEQRIAGADELYLSLSIDAETAQIRVLVSAHGGTEVESAAAAPGELHSVLIAPERLGEAAAAAVRGLPPRLQPPARAAVVALAEAFVALEAMLLEVNPLFVLPDGGASARWLAGDVKLVVDDSALVRQPALAALLEAHADLYPDSARKLAHGFDYVEINPDGEIGLVTTGAGLSMKLIDELLDQGHSPLNFCDIRSGQFRGDPSRLIQVLRWIGERPRVRVVLVNIFAGITDLGEFADLLVRALRAVPDLRVPIVARLIGRNLEAAQTIIAGSELPIAVEPDLDRALAMTVGVLAAEPRRG